MLNCMQIYTHWCSCAKNDTCMRYGKANQFSGLNICLFYKTLWNKKIYTWMLVTLSDLFNRKRKLHYLFNVHAFFAGQINKKYPFFRAIFSIVHSFIYTIFYVVIKKRAIKKTFLLCLFKLNWSIFSIKI